MTWGVRRPLILLPESALYWPGERLHAVLLHEIAHIRRRDSLTQMLALVTCAFYWPNPFVWMGARAEKAHFRRAAKAALAEAKPAGDNAFKIELARRVVARALTLAAAGTPCERSRRLLVG